MAKKARENRKEGKGRQNKKGKKGVAEKFMEAIDGSAEFIADQVTDTEKK